MFFSRSKMEAIIVIGIAGFIGANVRYVVSTWAAQAFGSAFPWGTLIINHSCDCLDAPRKTQSVGRGR
jgi:fluoride ion exporter CrcB/FEX